MVSLTLRFFFLCPFFTADYTVDKKNHTTVTTVFPKIGKRLHLVKDVTCGHLCVCWSASLFAVAFVFVSRRARCGCLSSSGDSVDKLVPDSLCGLFLLPQTLQPSPEHLLPPQQR